MKTMKKMFLLQCTILFGFALGFGQTADEIIEKHIEAHGGSSNWEKIHNMKVTGQFTAFSLAKDFTCIKTADGKYYGDLWLGKHHVYEAFDGHKGWTIDPWQDIHYARKVSKAETNVFRQNAELFTPFYKYEEKGYLVEYTGKDNIEGTDAYVLHLHRGNGFEETWYLDAETYLEIKCESQWIDFAYPLPSVAYYDDFREVNGIILPFYMERTFGTRHRMMEITSVEVNVDTDPTLFEMPRLKAMEKIAFMEGVWNVTTEAWTRRGWYKLDSVQSEMQFKDINLLEETIVYDRILPRGKQVDITYDSESEKYKMSVYDHLSFDIKLYLGTYNDTALIFDDLNVHTGDTTKNVTHMQFIYYHMEENQFVLETKLSQDKGKTWANRDKFIYTRKPE